jgi:hypothetical protein
VQVVLLERLSGDDREHTGDLESPLGVDSLDRGVGVGASHDVHVEHPGQLDVVHVSALAVEEARVLLALHRVTHSADLGRGFGGHDSS